jgi:flagellar motor switch protein FliM
MADEGLSPAELETLLAGDLGKNAKRPGSSARTAHRAASAKTVTPPAGIEPHDFRRPRTLAPEQLRALESLHVRFARQSTAALSTMLRANVACKLAATEQVPYAEFAGSRRRPTCFCVLRAAPLVGLLAADLELGIVFPLLDRLLGGGREPGPIDRRPLTDIEQRLMTRIMNVLLDELGRAWRDHGDVRFAIDAWESDPQASAVALPLDSVVRLTFELSIHGARGTLALCLPISALRPVAAKLGGTPEPSPRSSVDPEQTAAVREHLAGSSLELTVELASTRVRGDELFELSVGDILATETPATSPTIVRVAGVPKFHAYPGASGGNKAVRIEAAIEPPRGADVRPS